MWHEVCQNNLQLYFYSQFIWDSAINDGRPSLSNVIVRRDTFRPMHLWIMDRLDMDHFKFRLGKVNDSLQNTFIFRSLYSSWSLVFGLLFLIFFMWNNSNLSLCGSHCSRVCFKSDVRFCIGKISQILIACLCYGRGCQVSCGGHHRHQQGHGVNTECSNMWICWNTGYLHHGKQLDKLCFSALPSLQTLFWMCILMCKCDAVWENKILDLTWYTIWADPNYIWGLAILTHFFFFGQ